MRISDLSSDVCSSDLEVSGYIMDQHGAVAFCGLRSYMQESESRELNGVFLETAHPAKFKDTMEDVLQREIPVPERLAQCLDKPKKRVLITRRLDELQSVQLLTGETE